MVHILIAAVRSRRHHGEDRWTFYLVNTSSNPIESAVLEAVDYEWGEGGSTEHPKASFGPIAPGSSVELWREDESVEVRMTLTVLLHTTNGKRRIKGEFPMLYRVKKLSRIPILNLKGVIGVLF
jgi:hypothetical protein